MGEAQLLCLCEVGIESADAGSNSIVRVAPDQTSATTLPLDGLGSPLQGPQGLAVDLNHDLFIADTGSNRIVELSLISGKASLVDAVTALSQTELAIDTMVTVRDRVISAYEEIMKMPI